VWVGSSDQGMPTLMHFYIYCERRTPREKERIQSRADNLVYSAEHFLRNGSVWRIDTGTNNLDLVMALLRRDGSTWHHFRTAFVRVCKTEREFEYHV
jgi:hypothetical protein